MIIRKERLFVTHAAWNIVLLCAFLILAGQVRATLAENIDLPEAETVLKAYIEATGGLKAYEKVFNRITENVMELPGQGLKIKSVIKAAKPNLFRASMESGMLGNSDKGFDGKVVWENSTMTGPIVKEGKEKDAFLMLAVFDRITYWKEAFSKAECTGMEDVNDKPCYKVVMTPRESSASRTEGEEEAEPIKPMIWYFDTETDLLVRIDMTMESPMGSMAIESLLSDYKEVDGILLPFETVLKMMGQEIKTVTTSIKQNVELPADTFAPPEEIASLLENEA